MTERRRETRKIGWSDKAKVEIRLDGYDLATEEKGWWGLKQLSGNLSKGSWVVQTDHNPSSDLKA